MQVRKLDSDERSDMSYELVEVDLRGNTKQGTVPEEEEEQTNQEKPGHKSRGNLAKVHRAVAKG